MHLRTFIKLAGITGATLSLAVAAQPVSAEVTRQGGDGFVVRHEVVVKADAKATWLALISPAKWWNKSHTWSGDSANLSLRPQAGGCFCEKIPELADATRITLEGSVEHMRVVQAYPESALRMRGALGPLQGEAVTGVLTIALSEKDQGTRIVWEYVVGGYMRYDIAEIAPAVDGMNGQQVNALADFLGRVEVEESAPMTEEAAEPENVLDAIDALGKD